MQNGLNTTTKPTGRIRPILRDRKTGRIKFIGKWANNVFTQVGKTAIANRLGDIGAVANEGIITYGAVGTGASTPSKNDIAMLAEHIRKVVAATAVVGQTLTVETFFASAEGNDTLSQFALFGEDAGAGADSGTMFDYANFEVPFTKTANETLTVEVELIVA